MFPGCLLAVGLILLAIYDFRYFLLPNILTYGLLGLGLLLAFMENRSQFYDYLVGAIIGGAGLYSIALVYKYLRGREGMGLGDVKLFAAGGAWVGWQGLASIILIAAPVTLFAIGVMHLIRKTVIKEDQPVPFGVGLTFGIWLVWMYGPIENWIM